MVLTKKYVSRMLLIFVIGGIFGFLYEEIFYRIDLGYFVKRGTTSGPWIPIYGFGAVVMLLLARPHVRSPWRVFVYSLLAAGVLEFLTGLVLHRRFGVRLWDYNAEIWNWFNIGGYICLRSVLFFGASGLLLCYVVYPLLCRVTEPLSERAAMVLAVIPFSLFLMDIVNTVVRGVGYMRQLAGR